jgi:uncharacterized protein YgbK (DUF1537 family)
LTKLPLLEGKILFFIGSDHAVTKKQSRALQNLMTVEVDDPQNTLVMHKAELRNEIIQLKRGHFPEAGVSHAVEFLKPGAVGCLVMTGGDTAMLVCRTLGIHSLRLHDEFAPGLPRASAQGGIFNGVTVILKSGGFGNEDVLCRIAHAFSAKHEVMQ